MSVLLERGRSLFARPQPSQDFLAGPIRGELLGLDRLAERARSLARAQVVRPFEEGTRRTLLLSRLDVSRRVVSEAYARLLAASGAGTDVGPAGEWLLDNYHVVRSTSARCARACRAATTASCRSSRSGPLAGYPRVYEIAITLIAHTEARIDRANVELFVARVPGGHAAHDRRAVGDAGDAAPRR